ncbi:MAG: methionine adenosyltransferase [Euryarchaeota archaeon]|nr:methionine adenosyltransferase [Euryarchaeota archaeon]MBV1730060.1 methionine adenosyltransferase [Methanobacterium sp.]MBU4547381.1 methionine adenosyltransferase [Euryarchaeota archaeon]MBU4608908.1 methionine adenosyltransferase [Euryarchaeota archaeon]MBV1755117.1 methionine adenosyltransferase [Methanobacterium sp.]
MRNIIVEKLNQTPIEEQDIEIVERKGIGHPDSISDGIAESVSRALCNAYLERFGTIMHHNTDEIQITAGESNPMFGGGEVIKPMDILLTGRGISEIDGEKIGLDRIAITAAKEYLKQNIINLDVESCAVVECKIGHGSGDLRDVFARKGKAPLSNDTSFGVGFAPFSETETIVMEAAYLLNSPQFKKKYPAVGEDIKVMGLRERDKIILTVAVAMVDKYVDDLQAYLEMVSVVKEEVLQLARQFTPRDLEVVVNTADRCEEDGTPSVYITVTGTSAEMGDDGSAGRGNRANGLITPNRPMSLEATSGKNPINHVGKLYNLLSTQMAADVVEAVEGVQQVHIMILSQIGKPIDQPKAANSQIILQQGYRMEDVEKKVESVMDNWLEDTSSITEMLVKGKLRTF